MRHPSRPEVTSGIEIIRVKKSFFFMHEKFEAKNQKVSSQDVNTKLIIFDIRMRLFKLG